MSFALLFRRPLEFGVCAGVSLPQADDFTFPSSLHGDEARHVQTLPPARRASWVGGRVAMHEAVFALGGDDSASVKPRNPILATPRGAPALPSGLVGSISHKQEIAVALAARADGSQRRTIGVDLEIPRALPNDISGRVLTPDERALLDGLSGAARDREVLWRFAAKEAIYKALDPWVERLVSFQEVAIDRTPGGRASVRLNLAGGEGPFAVELEDASNGQLLLIAARVAKA